jgi:hypothetical protein
VDRPIPTTPAVEPYLAVTARTVYIRGGTSGEKKKRPGGFVHCQRLKGIVAQGYNCRD